MKTEKTNNPAGDLWGGLAAVLVAIPSAIAFGVTIFAPLGERFAASGAIAGILGTAALGVVASAFGGTKRLITAPCAPAAAVLSGLTIQQAAQNVPVETILVRITVIALLCGIFQIIFALLGLGRLIKYMPYPVVSGYLSGVGLIIILSQTPKLLGVSGTTGFFHSLTSPALWRWQGIIVGLVTATVMVGAPKVTKAVPAAILGLGSGVLTYFALAAADPSLRLLAGNKFVIGPVAASGAGFMEGITARARGAGALDFSQLLLLVTPALTLAVLLSIDTLKTCVVTDALTRSRHDSNRELVGQGLGNIAATAIGGIPGAGQMGATLVNISSGAQSRRSGLIEGGLAVLILLALAPVVAWVPIAALAAILIVVGVRMFDRNSLHLLRSRATILDFGVIAIVVIVAETVGLIAASGVGLALAMLLFIREKIGGTVVRRKVYGNEMFSKQVRLPQEMAVLEKEGGRTVIFELQGSLFFGTADQLYSALEPELEKHEFVVLDMRHVQSVDVTAAHVLDQIEQVIHEHGGVLLFSHLPRNVPTGQDMQQYFDSVGLLREEHRVLTFGHRDEALEYVEDRILGEGRPGAADQHALELGEFDLFRGRRPDTLLELSAQIETKSYKGGEVIFAMGDTGTELYLIRKGTVRVMLPLAGRTPHHLSTFGPGHFFGEMAFLDGKPRSANAVTLAETEVFRLSRERFERLAEEHRRMAVQVLDSLAKALAVRLRHADREISALQDL